MKYLTSPGKNGQSRSAVQPPAAIRVTRRLSAPPERVFHAWLEPEVAGRWLFARALHPLTDVEIEARAGGSFRFADRRDGEIIEHAGEYVEIVPHRRLVFTLAMADRPRVVTRVAVEISPLKTGCQLAVTHENVPPDHADDTEARWTGILYGLAETLGSLPRRGSPS
jgi:uncharacterized protein YndB with AHSA1/START domain